MAMLYDAFLLLAMLLCVSAVYTIIVVTINGDFAQHSGINTDDTIHELNPTELGWLIYPVLLGTYLGFFLYFWRSTGQTLGMLAWKIKLESLDEKPVTIQQGLKRIFFAAFSLAVFGAGYFALWFGQKNATWHDRLTNTRVIQTEPKK